MKTRNYLKALSVFFLLIGFSAISLAEGEALGDPAATAPVDPTSTAVENLGPGGAEAVNATMDADRALQKSLCVMGGTFQVMAAQCGVCAEQAANTCKNPEKFAEESGLNSTVSSFVDNAPLIGSLASMAGGEDMAQMVCYGNAVGALGGMLGAKAVSGRCKAWREGEQQNGAHGCNTVCGEAMKMYPQAMQVATASMNPDLIRAIQKNFSDIQKANQSCVGETQSGEQSSGAQAMQMANQMQEAKACMDGLGDDVLPEELLEADLQIVCGEPQFDNHPKCKKINGDKTLGGGELDLITADLTDGSGGGGLDDDFNPNRDAKEFNPDAQAKAGGAGGFGGGAGGGFGGGGFPAGGAAGSADGKKGKGGNSGKAKALISGHRSSASTGGSGGRRGKKGFNRFKLAKDKLKDKDGDALKALAAFAKAGISPNSEGGFIFERITNRFNTACNPKKFFDCSRNKVSWYEQNKFKKRK